MQKMAQYKYEQRVDEHKEKIRVFEFKELDRKRRLWFHLVQASSDFLTSTVAKHDNGEDEKDFEKIWNEIINYYEKPTDSAYAQQVTQKFEQCEYINTGYHQSDLQQLINNIEKYAIAMEHLVPSQKPSDAKKLEIFKKAMRKVPETENVLNMTEIVHGLDKFEIFCQAIERFWNRTHPIDTPTQSFAKSKLDHIANENIKTLSSTKFGKSKPHFKSHKPRQSDSESSDNESESQTPTCFYCDEKGHFMRECPKKIEDNKKRRYPKRYDNDDDSSYNLKKRKERRSRKEGDCGVISLIVTISRKPPLS